MNKIHQWVNWKVIVNHNANFLGVIFFLCCLHIITPTQYIHTLKLLPNRRNFGKNS